jgi:hypothetical protein
MSTNCYLHPSSGAQTAICTHPQEHKLLFAPILMSTNCYLHPSSGAQTAICTHPQEHKLLFAPILMSTNFYLHPSSGAQTAICTHPHEHKLLFAPILMSTNCYLHPSSGAQTAICTLGGSQGRSGLVRKISPSPGLDPRTIQPVASLATHPCLAPWLQKCSEILVLPLLAFLACYNVNFTFRPERKRPFGIPRCRCTDNIKMDLQEVGLGGVNLIDLTQDIVHLAGCCDHGVSDHHNSAS